MKPCTTVACSHVPASTKREWRSLSADGTTDICS